MKRKFTFLSAAFMLLAFLAFPLGMWADEASFAPSDFSGQGTSGTGSAISATVNGVTFACDKGYGTTQIRCYKDGTITISSSNTITAISFTFSGSYTGGLATSYSDLSTNSWSQTLGSQARIMSCSVTYSGGGSTLDPCDLALVDAPVELEFDLYDNADAQTISYTTSSTGEITVSQSDYITATVNANNTITVTPVAVTNGAQTITVNQAADDNYAAGSVTFTVNITDSTPSTGTDVTFDATVDKDLNNTSQGEGSIVKNGVTFACDNGILGNGTEYRLYKNSTTTFSVTSGTITQIVFTCPSSNPASGFATQAGWTTNGNNGTWTGSATSVSFVASSKQVRATTIVVTVEGGGTPDPTISASNVNIAYDATNGSIAYTINNEPSPAGTLTAAVTDGNWLTLGQGTTSPIAFTCSANENTTARTAMVTLIYTYNTDQTVSANVTVTQAAAPVIYSTIPALFDAATSTETNVLVTFNNWVVSGVSTNGKNVFVTDNNGNGFVIFDNNGGLGNTYTAGDILAGTAVSCNLKKYNGFAELLNVDANDLTITAGGTIAVANVAMADLAGVNTGALVHYDNLTCSVNNNKYYLSDGTTTLQVYNSLYAFDALTDGNTYNITGVYQQFNSTKEVLPRSADDIEEVTSATPTITVSNATVNAPAEGAEGTLTVTYENITTVVADVWFCDAAGTTTATYNWITADINAQNNVEYLVESNNGEARTAYLKVYALDDNGDDVYSNLVTVTQAAAPAMALYTYSINGVEGQTLEAEVGTPVTLAAGENLNNNFTFAGWTTDANDVENRVTEYTFNENEVVTFYAVYAHTTGSASTAKEGASYVKVTSTDDLEDGANYLIVSEDENEIESVAFDGSLQTLDGGHNIIVVEISNGAIASTTTTDAAAFTIEAIAETEYYSIKNADGTYIGRSGSSNGLDTGSEALQNSISFENGDAIIQGSGTRYLRFNESSGNSNYRFRYYSSSYGRGIQLYKYTDGGSTPTPTPVTTYYTRVFLNETVAADITIAGPSIVPNGQTLNMGTFTLNSDTYDNLIIEDGGQLKIANQVNGTIQKNVAGYGTSTNDNYVLLATPASMDACNNTGMWPTTGSDHQAIQANIDFYSFDQSAELEWQNFKHGQTSFAGPYLMQRGQGYLYANPNDVTLTLQTRGYSSPGIDYQAYPFEPTNEIYTVSTDDLGYTSGATWAGWNLVGNPFTCDAYLNRTYFRMNDTGDAIVEGDGAIKPCEGVFVVVTAEDKVVKFSDTPWLTSPSLSLNLNDNNQLMDRVSLHFDGSNNIKKFVLSENASKLYIQQGTIDYAVVRSNAEGEMPVSFKAENNGSYTISVNAENVEMNYLHLIDNLTGADIDLLATPSYSFEAKTTDYASRFRLVFNANTVTENSNEAFAYYNGSEWVINNMGEATLQVVDMMGRVLSTETVSGNATMNINSLSAGIYMMRLVKGEDVKVQKIVVR